MSGFVSFLKTILLPLLVALILYLAGTYLLLPLYRRHRTRYSQYLPLSSVSTRTSSLRHRVQAALLSFLLPSSWQRGSSGRRQPRNSSSSPYAAAGSRHTDDEDAESDDEEDDDLLDDEEGENMVGFGGREALEQRRSQVIEFVDSDRRLSRDLEEGFRDDSGDEDEQEEEEEDRRRRAAIASR